MSIKKTVPLLIIMSNIPASLISSELINPAKKKQILIDINLLDDVLKKEKKLTKQMEISPRGQQRLQGYAVYLQKLDDCRKKKGDEFHLNNTYCSGCNAAFNEADKLTRDYINQKSIENAIAKALAGTFE